LRIEPRPNAELRKNLVAHEVRRAHALGPAPEPVCDAHCPDYNASTGCHRDCRAVPLRLSSDGARNPLEPQVAPLVFELKKLGVFHPCWSCEGHDDAAGYPWKIPRIWFYADSVVHVRALADAVDRLVQAHRLLASWHVVLTHSETTNPDTTFSLEPEPAAYAVLDVLQSDLRVMADELGRHFWLACDALAEQAS
jgi:hypothetical protein